MESHQDISNLGALGRFYSARNVLGFYRSTCVLSVCSFPTEGLPDPDAWFKQSFYEALFHTIKSHPSLCYGILDETPEREAVFLRLPVIHRDDIAEFCGEDVAESDDIDASITKLLEISNARILGEGHRKPAWRVVVLKHGAQWNDGSRPTVQRLSIALLCNHAIADGLSHVIFHKFLFRFFNTPVVEKASWPLQVPRDLPTPVLLEDVVDLLQVDEATKPNIDYTAPSIWSGANMFLPSIDEYESGVRLVNLSEAQKNKVAHWCRNRKVTLTGLMHGLIVTFLARVAPTGSSFLAVTPYSMRHVSKVSEDEFCNHAGGLVHDFAVPLVNAIRRSIENSVEEIDLIIQVAQLYRKDMADELARTPKNNAWAGMLGVKDWYGPSKTQLGKKRALTYEHSSFGNLKVVENTKENTALKPILELERMIVSQCGSVTGPVFCCNLIGLAGGPLTASITWQKGSIEEKTIEDLTNYLKKRLEEDFQLASSIQ